MCADKWGNLGFFTDLDLEAVDRLRTPEDDPGDPFDDPPGPMRGVVLGVILGSILWIVAVTILWTVGLALMGG